MNFHDGFRCAQPIRISRGTPDRGMCTLINPATKSLFPGRIIFMVDRGWGSGRVYAPSAYQHAEENCIKTSIKHCHVRHHGVEKRAPAHARRRVERKDGRLRFVSARNTSVTAGLVIGIPLHPDLAHVIASMASEHMTFLVTDYGRPFTPNGFGNAFKEWCRQANRPHCTAHGLRKATAARLAERGATAHEIMAITGHRTLEEIERYTRSARQAKLADPAMAKFRSS